MNDVTRSTEATSASAASYAARRRQALPNGMWGVALLVATEAALFGTVLATYFYLRFQTTTWPPPGIDPPKVALPLVLTAALVSTSIPALLASRAARRGRGGRAFRLLLLALLVQAGYLAVQILLFKRDLGDFSPRDTAYGSIYFSLLALHHVHVLVGLLLELGILAKLLGGLTSYREIGVRVVALYWHFVNAMAVLVVLTQLSPSL
jgi:heme/copper-type cytochrome/quinol oxidase subunit 3